MQIQSTRRPPENYPPLIYKDDARDAIVNEAEALIAGMAQTPAWGQNPERYIEQFFTAIARDPAPTQEAAPHTDAQSARQKTTLLQQIARTIQAAELSALPDSTPTIPLDQSLLSRYPAGQMQFAVALYQMEAKYPERAADIRHFVRDYGYKVFQAAHATNESPDPGLASAVQSLGEIFDAVNNGAAFGGQMVSLANPKPKSPQDLLEQYTMKGADKVLEHIGYSEQARQGFAHGFDLARAVIELHGAGQDAGKALGALARLASKITEYGLQTAHQDMLNATQREQAMRFDNAIATFMFHMDRHLGLTMEHEESQELGKLAQHYYDVRLGTLGGDWQIWTFPESGHQQGS